MMDSSNEVFPLTLIRVGGLPMERLERLGKDWEPYFLEQALLTQKYAKAQEGLRDVLDNLLRNLPDSPARTAVYNVRKQFYQGKIKDWSPLSLVPQVLVAAGFDWQSAVKRYEDAKIGLSLFDKKFENKWRFALLENYAELQTIAKEEPIQRGLLFASHDLLRRIPAFCRAAPLKFSKKERQVALSIYQYVSRAAAKTSPFSQFTTVHFQKIERLGHHLDGFDGKKAVVTPNVAILEALYDLLLKFPDFYQHLTVRLNPCLDGVKTVYEFLYFDGAQESVQQLTADPPLDFLVEYFEKAPNYPTFQTLLNELAGYIEAPPEMLNQFLYELTEIGFLEWVWPESGLKPNWTSGLYNFLGHLPGLLPVIVETASLLQWLRTAARTMPFQSIDQILALQNDTWEYLEAHFRKFGGHIPQIPLEKLYYEDVAEPVFTHAMGKEVEQLLRHFRDFTKRNSIFRLSKAQYNMLQFFKAKYSWRSVSFLEFFKAYHTYKSFLEGGSTDAGRGSIDRLASAEVGRVGALVQIYRKADGTLGCVANALFPGGGKLFARWIGLSNFLSEFQQLNSRTAKDYAYRMMLYDWQGWYNANVMIESDLSVLSVAGSRSSRNLNQERLGQFNLILTNFKGVELRYKQSQTPIRLIDLGLEAPETRPPAMQMLWNIGVPNVTIRGIQKIEPEFIWLAPAVRFFKREGTADLTVRRATWIFEETHWKGWLAGKGDFQFFEQFVKACLNFDVPRYVFYRFSATKQKPQYLDMGSPISVLLFEKDLRSGAGDLEIAEMLPTPSQLIVDKDGKRVGEFVVEINI